jgi:hypothetical protein
MARKTQGDMRASPRGSVRDRRDTKRGATVIPRPGDGDFEDVHWALSAASTLWERGEDSEALKWLRRAASAAAERDADARAVELFKAAAEVASFIDARKTVKGLAPTPPDSVAPAAPDLPVPLTVPKPAATPQPVPKPVAAPPPLPNAVAAPIVPRPAAAQAREPVTRPAPQTRTPAGRPGARIPRALVGLNFDDAEENTLVRPETAVRRALMAIDPDYARRTDYHDEEPSSQPPSSQGEWPEGDEKSEREDTERRSSSAGTSSASGASDAGAAAKLPGALPAVRVAVLPIPEERDVRLVFLSPGAEPPPGVAVAMLVPVSEEDARRLASVYEETDSKV